MLSNVAYDQECVIKEVAELLETKRSDVLVSPWWWPAMVRGEAKAAWDTLTCWVDEVLIGRYDTPGRSAGGLAEGASVKPCWFAHPDVVDKLSALYWAWRRGYSPSATATGPIDWHMNWVPRTLGQIKSELTSCLGGCSALGVDRVKAGQLTHQDRVLFVDNDITARREADTG
jgi:hypothetical protein